MAIFPFGSNNMSTTNQKQKPSNQWRNVAAYVYLFICIFDFVVMPTLTFFFHTPPTSLITLITQLSPANQADLIKDFYGPWSPLTENSGGLFHIVFLTLLGVISWQSGKLETEIAKTQMTASLPKPEEPHPKPVVSPDVQPIATNQPK